jgi:hypothetical protein
MGQFISQEVDNLTIQSCDFGKRSAFFPVPFTRPLPGLEDWKLHGNAPQDCARMDDISTKRISTGTKLLK